MEKETFYWKLFGWFVYASRIKLHVFPAKQAGRNSVLPKMRQVKNTRYREKKGCCESCGKHFDKSEMQMHHIMPFNEFPQWKRKPWNLMMLCPKCHYLIHRNLLKQVELMQRVANKKCINLQQAYQQAAINKWRDYNNHHINN